MPGLENIRMLCVVRKEGFMGPAFQQHRGIFVPPPTNLCVQLYKLHIGLQINYVLLARAGRRALNVRISSAIPVL